MEYMQGGSLTEVLGPEVDFPESHIAYVCKQVLPALEPAIVSRGW